METNKQDYPSLKLELNYGAKFKVRLEVTEAPFEIIETFLATHSDKPDSYLPMDLFLARDWFNSRGYQASVKITPTVSLYTKLWSRLILSITEFVWKHRGMKEFEPR